METAARDGRLPFSLHLIPLPPFKPDLYQRAWSSTPHPTLPLLATAHAKSVTVFSLSTLSKHSALTGGHARSVRCAAWKPALGPHKLCLVTGSFDATAGLWRWENNNGDGADFGDAGENGNGLAVEVTAASVRRTTGEEEHDVDEKDDDDDWEFTLVLEGHESEVKSVCFSPGGNYLATCSRDKTVWIWEDVGASEEDDEWETVAVLSEHSADVKALAWCPDVPGRTARGGRRYSADVLASASYDNTVRIWREDSDSEWVCVAVLEGHEGTVWGLQWEGKPRKGDRFPRLLTFSADRTIRIWTLKEEDDEENAGWSGLGIPNTMRRSQHEEWICTAVLPAIHTRDIYSATWSTSSGLVASTGSDGMIVVYGEEDDSAAAEPDVVEEDVHMASPPPAAEPSAEAVPASESNGHDPTGEDAHPHAATNGAGGSQAREWRILTKIENGHGPYEINHVTWCKRSDPGTEKKGIEEMLVTTADDGIVRPWQVIIS